MPHHRKAYYIINGITVYRIIAAPVLLWLIIIGRNDIFKWLLAISFLTDFIDGWLSRRFRVSSIIGAKLDSIGDDLTVAVGIIGVFISAPEFIQQHKLIFLVLLFLFLIQLGYAFIQYRRMTNFHTYLAKLAAILQGVFLILFYFLPDPVMPLFYAAAGVTGMQIIEEIILIRMLPEWEADVKGIYWVLQRKKRDESSSLN